MTGRRREELILGMLRSAIKKLAGNYGYEVRRIVPDYFPYEAQKRLVTNLAPVIFDVGAHVGGMSRKYRGDFPGSMIYAFEPAPDSYAQLEKFAAIDGRIHTLQAALSDSRGELTFYINASQATNSLLPTEPEIEKYWGQGPIGAPALATKKTVAVQAETLDDFCREKGIAFIDILKIDAQGGEFAILKGARQLFYGKAIGLVYLEILVAPTYAGQPALSQYFAFFERYGYALYNVFDISHRGEGRLVQFDAIFIAPR